MAEAAVVKTTPKTTAKSGAKSRSSRGSTPPPLVTMASEEVSEVAQAILDKYQGALGVSIDEDLEKRVNRQLRKELRSSKEIRKAFLNLTDAEAKQWVERIEPYLASGTITHEQIVDALDHTRFVRDLPALTEGAFHSAMVNAYGTLDAGDREELAFQIGPDVWNMSIARKVKDEIGDAEARGRDRVDRIVTKADIRKMPKNAWQEVGIDLQWVAHRPLGSWRRVIPAGIVGFLTFEVVRQTVLSDQAWAQSWYARAASPLIAILAIESLAWAIRAYSKSGKKKSDKKSKREKNRN